MQDVKKCPHCKEDKHLDEFYKRREGKDSSTYCKDCANIQTRVRQKALKKTCVDYLGGECATCGYKSYVEALEFHHLDPKEKEFSISKVRSYSFAKIKPELDKCVLLCANCHRETHADLHKGVDIEWAPVAKVFKDVSLDSYQKPVSKTKIEWPSDKELLKLVWEFPRSHLAKVLKVSDVAIAKRLKLRGIDQPPRGYWSKLRSSM
jgi:hypothetical protein